MALISVFNALISVIITLVITLYEQWKTCPAAPNALKSRTSPTNNSRLCRPPNAIVPTMKGNNIRRTSILGVADDMLRTTLDADAIVQLTSSSSSHPQLKSSPTRKIQSKQRKTTTDKDTSDGKLVENPRPRQPIKGVDYHNCQREERLVQNRTVLAASVLNVPPNTASDSWSDITVGPLVINRDVTANYDGCLQETQNEHRQSRMVVATTSPDDTPPPPSYPRVKLSRRQKKNSNRRRDVGSISSDVTALVLRSMAGEVLSSVPERPLDNYTALNLSPAEIYRRLHQRYTLTMQEMYDSGYPIQMADGGVIYNYVARRSSPSPPADLNAHQKVCCRCNRSFCATATEYITVETCSYHWGRKMQTGRWSCCQREATTADGCTFALQHVWSGSVNGQNGPFRNFVPTNRQMPSAANSNAIYALDCEMAFTVAGLEAIRVTVVGCDGGRVYDSLIQPANPILDYNTRFSGICPADFQWNPVKPLATVQRDLRRLLGPATVLVGHALENDLRALRMLHRNVVDTAVLFPHWLGYPMKRSLASLVQEKLQRRVQCGRHDSFEDACAAMDLTLYKLRTCI